VSQATVSRDISELKLVKHAGREKKFKYVVIKKDFNSVSSKILNLYKSVVLSVCSANNLIVIKTLSGNASTAGMAIDEMHIPEILGTVAGDDTLLVIAKTNADAEMIIKSLKVL
jgi:transcriptional regulator of arginine metabolism